jgi:putative spermidine/putrescine transport system ATP-binding protein
MTAATGLEVLEAQVRFGRLPGLEGLSLQVARGERVALVGPSGGGKTSLLRAIAGLDALAGGRIVVGGHDVTAAAPEARRVVYLHQAPSLFPHLSVLDNVAFPLEVRGTDRVAARRRAHVLLEGVGLAPLAARRGASLSGGQRHRAALARALAAEPEVLLLDEPFAALDPALRAEVRDTVVALLDARGPAVVLVTHDIDEASGFAHRLAVLLDRRLVQVAPPTDLLRAPASVDVARFLGIPNIVRGVRDGDGTFVSPLGRCPSLGATGAAVLVARPDAIVASPGGEWFIESRHERIGGTVLRVRREELVVTVTPVRGGELRVGDRVRLEVDMARAHIIAADDVRPPAAASPDGRVDRVQPDGQHVGGSA